MEAERERARAVTELQQGNALSGSNRWTVLHGGGAGSSGREVDGLGVEHDEEAFSVVTPMAA